MKGIILPTRALSSILQDHVITTSAGNAAVSRYTVASRHVLVTSRAPMAAARTIHVSMEEPACNEICEPTSVRYNCSCPAPFVGKHCEIQLRKSCQDYKAAGENTSGLYEVIDNSNRTFQVFCDFHSEPGFAWNLIQSFSLANKDLVKGVVLSDYTDSSAVSGDTPNWQAYLIRPAYLAWLGNQSTHWRATCRYDTDGVVYRDYMRTSLGDFDIMNIQEPVRG
ncbi:hypothetical protein OS493_009773 [Desmophyllum pertusum]|uniref:EGF-like domain-containing protein n=1 Tax=Desmophyllum pertusum TaxID=174260 RepID=A0A9W9YR96_9CNID|nr:hypothetical protein OS493_009773 [Desmophyllum pertusum]